MEKKIITILLLIGGTVSCLHAVVKKSPSRRAIAPEVRNKPSMSENTAKQLVDYDVNENFIKRPASTDIATESMKQAAATGETFTAEEFIPTSDGNPAVIEPIKATGITYDTTRISQASAAEAKPEEATTWQKVKAYFFDPNKAYENAVTAGSRQTERLGYAVGDKKAAAKGIAELTKKIQDEKYADKKQQELDGAYQATNKAWLESIAARGDAIALKGTEKSTHRQAKQDIKKAQGALAAAEKQRKSLTTEHKKNTKIANKEDLRITKLEKDIAKADTDIEKLREEQRQYDLGIRSDNLFVRTYYKNMKKKYGKGFVDNKIAEINARVTTRREQIATAEKTRADAQAFLKGFDTRYAEQEEKVALAQQALEKAEAEAKAKEAAYQKIKANATAAKAAVRKALRLRTIAHEAVARAANAYAEQNKQLAILTQRKAAAQKAIERSNKLIDQYAEEIQSLTNVLAYLDQQNPQAAMEQRTQAAVKASAAGAEALAIEQDAPVTQQDRTTDPIAEQRAPRDKKGAAYQLGSATGAAARGLAHQAVNFARGVIAGKE